MLLQYKQAFIRDLSYLSWYLGTQDKALGAYIHQEHRRVLTCGFLYLLIYTLLPPTPKNKIIITICLGEHGDLLELWGMQTSRKDYS